MNIQSTTLATRLHSLLMHPLMLAALASDHILAIRGSFEFAEHCSSITLLVAVVPVSGSPSSPHAGELDSIGWASPNEGNSGSVEQCSMSTSNRFDM